MPLTRQRIFVVYPEECWVSPEQIIMWARDDIRNGKSALAERPQDVLTLEDALAVLDDSGTVTVDRRRSGL
jgi:hypothetical protein